MLPSMAVIPDHTNPMGKQDSLDTWRHTGRISVPSREGHIIDLIIVAIYETTAVNGQPLGLLIDARKTVNDPIKQFGVIFSKNPPDWSQYSIPILWREDGKAGVGQWR
jgi:hypothetical protein